MANERVEALKGISDLSALMTHIEQHSSNPMYAGLGDVFSGDSFDETALAVRIEVNLANLQREDPKRAMEHAVEGVFLKISMYNVLMNQAAVKGLSDDPDIKERYGLKEGIYRLKLANEYLVLAKYVDSEYQYTARSHANDAFTAIGQVDRKGNRRAFAGELADALASKHPIEDTLFDDIAKNIKFLEGILLNKPVAEMKAPAKQVLDISSTAKQGQAALYQAYLEAREGLVGDELAQLQHQYLQGMYKLTGQNIHQFDEVAYRDGAHQASAAKEFMQVYLEYVENLYTMEKDGNRPELREIRLEALAYLKSFAKYAVEHLPGVGRVDADLSGRNLAVAIMDLPQHNKLDSIRGLLGRPGYEHPPLSKWAKAWVKIKSFFGAKPAQSTYEELAKPEGAMPAQEAPAKDDAVVHFEEGKPMPTGFEDSPGHEPNADAPKQEGPDEPEEGKGIAPGAERAE